MLGVGSELDLDLGLEPPIKLGVGRVPSNAEALGLNGLKDWAGGNGTNSFRTSSNLDSSSVKNSRY